MNADVERRDTLEGLFSIPLAVKDGARNGTRELILATQASRKNLTVKLNTFVTRIVFADEPVDGALVATGLEAITYADGKQVYKASPLADDAEKGTKIALTARKEIIVAAGAFNTPQILMLSGIGPSAHLAEMGIKGARSASGKVLPIVDLPGVGGNLQDRYEVCVVGDQPEGKELELLAGCTFNLEGDVSKDRCFDAWVKD